MRSIPLNEVFYHEFKDGEHLLLQDVGAILLDEIEKNRIKYIILDEVQKVQQYGGMIRRISGNYMHVQVILCGSTTGLSQ